MSASDSNGRFNGQSDHAQSDFLSNGHSNTNGNHFYTPAPYYLGIDKLTPAEVDHDFLRAVRYLKDARARGAAYHIFLYNALNHAAISRLEAQLALAVTDEDKAKAVLEFQRAQVEKLSAVSRTDGGDQPRTLFSYIQMAGAVLLAAGLMVADYGAVATLVEDINPGDSMNHFKMAGYMGPVVATTLAIKFYGEFKCGSIEEKKHYQFRFSPFLLVSAALCLFCVGYRLFGLKAGYGDVGSSMKEMLGLGATIGQLGSSAIVAAAGILYAEAVANATRQTKVETNGNVGAADAALKPYIDAFQEASRLRQDVAGTLATAKAQLDGLLQKVDAALERLFAEDRLAEVHATAVQPKAPTQGSSGAHNS